MNSRPTPLLSVLLGVALISAAAAGCVGTAKEGVLRLGYFPNLTHAQPLYGIASGLYQEKLGETKLETTVFNAGPAAFEALLSGHVDVIYVGPSPTISAIESTGLEVIRIVSGSASGGASFILRDDVTIASDDDLGGKKFASPALGNTQDVALKHYLKERGHETTAKGGDVDVIPAPNPDIVAMFNQKQIDGAWVPEPWATRLQLEEGGKLYVNESSLWEGGKFVTTHIVTTKAFLDSRGDDVQKLLSAHAEATTRLSSGGSDVLSTINDGLEDATGQRLKDETLAASFPKIAFDTDPLQSTFQEQYQMSADLGFTKGSPPSGLMSVYALQYIETTPAAE